MDISRRAVTLGSLSFIAGTSMSSMIRAEEGFAPFEGLDEFVLATDAYVYGYPLVTIEMTRRVITNVAQPEGLRAPMGQIIKARQYPNASFRDVTAPNADTTRLVGDLYSLARFRARNPDERIGLAIGTKGHEFHLVLQRDGLLDHGRRTRPATRSRL